MRVAIQTIVLIGLLLFHIYALCPPPFQGRIRKYLRWFMYFLFKIPPFPVWKNLLSTIGPKTWEEFELAIERAGMEIRTLGREIDKISDNFVSDLPQITLYNVSVRELGFKDGEEVPRSRAYAKAFTLGLALCPSGVDCHLRLQYKDQPEGEWLEIAAEPVQSAVADGNLLVLLTPNADPVLSLMEGEFTDPDQILPLDYRIIFARKK